MLFKVLFVCFVLLIWMGPSGFILSGVCLKGEGCLIHFIKETGGVKTISQTIASQN